MRTIKGKLALMCAVLLCCAAAMLIIVSSEGNGRKQINTDNGLSSITVAFSTSGTQNQWRITELNSLIAAAEDFDCEFIYRDAEDSSEQQCADIAELVSLSPDYLVIAPRDESIVSAVTLAGNAGIPVIIIERSISGDQGTPYLTTITSDLYDEGVKVGEYVKQIFDGRDCTVLEITGFADDPASKERAQGFEHSIKDCDNIKVVATDAGNYTHGIARMAVKNLIEEYGADNIDAIFAQNDDMAIDAIAAVEATGLKAGEDILIFSDDGSAEGIRAIIAGKLVMTVECLPLYGEIVFDVISSAERGENIPSYIPMDDGTVIDINNAEELLPYAW